MWAIWGVADHLRHICMGDYSKESRCGGVQAIWGVTDRLHHIRTGDYGKELHWVAQGRRGDMACRRLLMRGSGDVQYGATSWAIAIISYSEGVGNCRIE